MTKIDSDKLKIHLQETESENDGQIFIAALENCFLPEELEGLDLGNV